MGWSTYVIGSLMLGIHAATAGGWERAQSAFDQPWVWWCLLYSGAIGTALANISWYFAIGRIGQSRASPFLYWLPIFGVGFSALMLDEPLGWWHLIGLALVVAGTRVGRGRPIVPV